MDLNKLKAQAQDLIQKRGGTDALKEDAEELKDIATGKGSASDKASKSNMRSGYPLASGTDRRNRGRLSHNFPPPSQAG